MKQARADKDDMRVMFAFFRKLEETLGDLQPGAGVDYPRLGMSVAMHWGDVGRLGVGTSWRRVLYGMEVLLDNCTDPDADTLEWSPAIREWLESQTSTPAAEKPGSES